MTPSDPAAEIRAVIERVTTAWRDGPPGEIVARVLPCLDENVVVCDANFRVVARGAASCAASYEQFVRMATVHEFVAPDPEIHVAGDAATAVCPWTMTYTLNNETYTESGHEIQALSRSSGTWRIMWRAMLPASS